MRRVIDRTVQVGKRLPLPGEGDERPFRDWLKSQLLVAVLGWPDERVKVGERFDILLLDEFDHPVVTIETKAPYHRSTKEEQKTFRERFLFYTTLRVAYFTNGPEWDRLDLASLERQQAIHKQVSLEISQANAELAESFFAPLRDELLDREIFTTLEEAKILIEQWRKEYNQIRPHSAKNYRPPAPETIITMATT